ncbi:FHA domain-containing protein [Candidatus Parabeggiatoa sp. HSG14]|uniref:FHA domain-containing protein n=1 Tax=Candidatus Parabeggiatoa sp. HSG14 TaxID=3055593 RepID=UPI0025A89DEF|nr:FHA domain-containing protein [Thiotrichales bacterium HSG14]
MKKYLVGRSNSKVDITITDPERTVSGIHLELIEDTGDNYYVVDCNSKNGTYHQQNGQWKRIIKDYVKVDEPLLLGKYQTSVHQLLTILTKQDEES